MDLATLGSEGRPVTRAAGETAAALISHHLALGRRGFVVCGPSAGSGASFVAANLAVALAQAGVSTLLVDANLHDPGQQAYFPEVVSPFGLRQVLTSAVEEAIVLPEVAPNLSVLHAGGPAGAGADELIASERFGRFVQALLRDHDCTIVDAPPANTSAAALHIGSVVGYALVVARCRVSFAEDVSLMVDQLEQQGVSVIGAVLNAA